MTFNSNSNRGLKQESLRVAYMIRMLLKNLLHHIICPTEIFFRIMQLKTQNSDIMVRDPCSKASTSLK